MTAPGEAPSGERILVGIPAARQGFPHGIGLDAASGYMRLRDEAWSAVASGDSAAALNTAVRCLEEAAWLAHRATECLTRAARESDEIANIQASLAGQRQALDAERHRMHDERAQFEMARRAVEADRQDLRAALMAAEERAQEDARGGRARKGTRSAHRREPEPVLPDHDASLRPDPSSAGDPAAFMKLLRQFRIWAGNPSYRNMAARDQRFTASALHAALGRDVLPARHDMVDAVIAGCGGSEEDRSIWATAWRRLAMQPSSGVALAQVLTLPEPTESA